eukprot:gene20828-32112_t
MASVIRLSAFSRGSEGGNPAGVQMCEGSLPPAETMQRIAKEVGFPETAFLRKDADAWTVRYFSPAAEIPFCGHATLASGSALGTRLGHGTFVVVPPSGDRLEVTTSAAGDLSCVGFVAPPCKDAVAQPDYVSEVLSCISIAPADIDPAFIPVTNVNAGGSVITIVMLSSLNTLKQASYDYDRLKAATAAAGVVTVCLAWNAPGTHEYQVRVFGPAAGIKEDPATGSAAICLFHYLRSHASADARPAAITIKQGDYITPDPFPSDLRVVVDSSGTVTLQGT